MATTKTGSVSKTYGNLEGDGAYDFRLGSFSPMPKIPAGADLTSLTYVCKARRNWGSSGANGKVEVDAGGTLITVFSGMKYNTDYGPASVDLKPYTRTYADGTILFSNGSDELHVEVQHSISLLGTSWWMITENVITAYYSLPVYTITVNASPTAGGTVTGGGNYDKNTTATLTATPATGYKFKQWSDGNTSATRTITATADATYTATFEKLTYAVSTSVSPTNGGTVTGGGTYGHGDTATLTATPATGYRFKCWQDDTSNTNATRNVTVTGAVTYTAVFERLTYRVRWYNEDGSVLLETDDAVPYGDTPSCSVTPTKAATAQYTYTHIGWAVSPTAENTTGLTAVVANIDYYARFRADTNKYTVTWKNDDGTVLETDTLVPYGTSPDYNGATPTKASTAQYDYTFLGWSAKVEDPPLDEDNLPTVSGHITYTAVYLPVVRKYDLDIITDDCTVEGAVSGTYDYGTVFAIKVIPDFGYEVSSIRLFDANSDMYEYEGDELTFLLTGDTLIRPLCLRLPIPIKANLEQVTGVYIVPDASKPDTGTIVYVINVAVPTVEIDAKCDMQAIDGWSFLVSNSVPNNGYPLEKLFINNDRVY